MGSGIDGSFPDRMKLSDEQVAIIQERIDRSQISIPTLKDDVLDHLCCAVESKLAVGKTFEEATPEAIRELAPDGLDEIQQETVFLLNTKVILMKKAIYSIGLASAIAMSIGLMFKFMRWPGADQLITYGFLGFSLLFVPMAFADHFKVKQQASLPEKLRILFGMLSAAATALSVTLKLFHLPGADYLLLIGAMLFSFGFLPFLFFGLYKKSVS
jgi:hypothetical protein